MLCYRVCNHIEASYQTVGEPRKAAPGKHIVTFVQPNGLFATMFPEVWRRYQNRVNALTGYVWDHTLLLEVPDDIEEVKDHGLAGMEYRLDDPSTAIVRAIAGPEWPVPDWLPQPTDEREWLPTSSDWQDGRIFYWTPRGVDPKTLWYHPDQPAQQKQRREYGKQLRMQNLFEARLGMLRFRL